MLVEWFLFVALLAASLLYFASRLNGRSAKWLLGGAGVAVLLAGFVWNHRLRLKQHSRAQLAVPEATHREEYAGSESCRACHPNQYSSWHRSFHRTMTQVASPETVMGDFNDVRLQLDGEEYRLQRRGDEYWVQMPDPDPKLRAVGPKNVEGASRVQRRISLLTGSHHMQAFWTDNKNGNQQFSFPFIYLFEQQRWVPRRSVFIRNPADTDWAQVWNVGCISCHSTAGQPRMEDTATATFSSKVAELGIACEACHGPAGRHVQRHSNPISRYQAHLRNRGDDKVVNPAKLATRDASEICGQCHSVGAPIDEKEWLKNGYGYRPGESLAKHIQVLSNPRSREIRLSSFWSDGMIRVSGREYNGLIKSPCYLKGELSCMSCHSMHESSPTNQLAARMESNAACLQCHEKLANNLQQHTHHAEGSSGSLCYNCHMPYTTYGLLKALRSHQISSPSLKAELQTGRPNACNLCHLDRTLAWAGRNLSEWYGQPAETLGHQEEGVAASVLWALRGDAGLRALTAWHMGWSSALDISQRDWIAPFLAVLMQDHYPAVRYIAGRSMKRLPGFEGVPYDYLATDRLARSAEQVFALWQSRKKTPARSELLQNQMSELNQSAVKELLAARNNRVVELNE